MLAAGVVVRETYGNGFVTRVEVRNAETGEFETVSTETDPSQPGTPVDYLVSWPKTAYSVDAVRIIVDTNHNLSTYEEIDAVWLLGHAPPPPQASSTESGGGPVGADIAARPPASFVGSAAVIDQFFHELWDETPDGKSRLEHSGEAVSASHRARYLTMQEEARLRPTFRLVPSSGDVRHGSAFPRRPAVGSLHCGNSRKDDRDRKRAPPAVYTVKTLINTS